MTRWLGGIDEAGYGPLLGPLTLGYALFELPGDGDPYELLSSAVARDPGRGERRLVVADSKRLGVRTARGARRLEDAALSFLALAPDRAGVPKSGIELFRGKLSPPDDWLERHPWYAGLERALPLFGERGALELAAERLRRAAAGSAVRLVAAGVRALPEGDYNAGLAACEENKSALLWRETLGLIAHLAELARGREAELVIDRQGGRAKYGPLLARGLLGHGVRLVREEPGESAYDLVERGGPGRLRVRFVEEGESASLPTALASILAKYARELAMEAFNAHFRALDPTLAPTAGYTTDGRRWLGDAGETLRRAGIDPARLVRRR